MDDGLQWRPPLVYHVVTSYIATGDRLATSVVLSHAGSPQSKNDPIRITLI